MNQEFFKKYGVWIAAGALVLYLVYRQMGGRAPRLLPQAGGGGADYAAETERLRQAGALDIQRLQLNSQIELARLKAANDRYNLEQQALARRRALDAAARGQTLGLVGQIANSIGSLLKGQAGSPARIPGPSTPPTFPSGGSARTQPQLPPYYPVPEPNIPNVYNPPYYPDYPVITDFPLPVTDWGEAPQFGSVGMDVDTGASFYDQYGASPYSEAFYGFDFNAPESALPELGGQFYDSSLDPGGYSAEFYGFDFGGGGGGYYGPSVATDPGGYSEDYYGFDFG